MTLAQILYVLAKAAHREGENLVVGGLVSPSEFYSLKWGDLDATSESAVETVLLLFEKALSAGKLIPDDFQGYKKLTVYRVTATTSALTRSWLKVLCTRDYERIAFPFPSEVLEPQLPYVREFVVAFKGSRNSAANIIQALDLQT